MSLPVVSGRQVIRALTKVCFEIVGGRGSHVRLKKKEGKMLIVIVPDYKELARGTVQYVSLSHLSRP